MSVAVAKEDLDAIQKKRFRIIFTLGKNKKTKHNNLNKQAHQAPA
jgi:hypothetical protein